MILEYLKLPHPNPTQSVVATPLFDPIDIFGNYAERITGQYSPDHILLLRDEVDSGVARISVCMVDCLVGAAPRYSHPSPLQKQ